ncbi:MAG: aminopeptidase N [Actinomycetaceae bacterium]|nr:aminopeptidase N [Actinomycetaceae bacterium]
MRTITKAEALQRAQDITWVANRVELDLTNAEDLEAATFGSVTVLDFISQSETTFIDLIADSVSAVTVDGEPAQYHFDGARITLEELPTGRELEVRIDARCRYSRSGEGLHRYRDPEDGRVYLYTQFEPTDARRVYACFDQPGMKARWSMQVKACSDWVVLSNQPATQTNTTQDGFQLVSFAPTPPLSAYITAVVAGPYKYFDGGTWSGGASDGGHVEIPLGLYCRQALAKFCDAEDIFHTTRTGLDFYHDRYGFTYPWGKYDQVFVPEYNLGAMENPGCVTFTEDYLYRDTPTQAQKQSRANTIFHEMCHMWFGDLVTPAWWDDLWLKESFADNQGSWGLVETGLYPGEWATFAAGRKEWAYHQDQLPTTHPIAADIPDVEAAKHNFDGITYAKGAAVLKQLVAYVGPEAFFAGARTYFQDHAFGATSLPDFLSALQDASHREDLDQWQQAWLHTASPSRLRSDLQASPGSQTAILHLEQSCTDAVTGQDVLRPHALRVGLYSMGSGRGRVGSVDVTLRERQLQVELSAAQLDTSVDFCDVDLVVCNDDDLTYAVMQFDEAQLATALEHVGDIPQSVSRAVVWSALWAAVLDGRVDPARYLQAAARFAPQETDAPLALDIANRALEVLGRYLPGGRRRQLGAAFASTAIARIAQADRDSDDAKLWAQVAVRTLALLDDDNADFTAFLEDLAALRSPLLEVGPSLAWRARTVLAARGLLTEEDIKAALAADPSGEAHESALVARSAMPTRTARLRAWDQVVSQDLANDDLSAILSGLHLGAARAGAVGLTTQFFANVDEYWDNHTIGMGRRFLAGAYPARVDLDFPEDAQAVLSLAQAWLEARAHAPHALVRLMREGYDNLQRSYRLQKQWMIPNA